MTPAARHLAHFNWSTLVADIDSPKVRDFVRAVDRVNGIAGRSDGFVWRCGNEGSRGRKIGWPLFDNQRVIASFSVWETPDALRNFVYKTVHGAFLRRGPEWFKPGHGPNYVLWWVPAGRIPAMDDARARVDAITMHGPHAEAFDFAWLDTEHAA